MNKEQFESAAKVFSGLERTVEPTTGSHKDAYFAAAQAVRMYVEFPAGLRKLVNDRQITESHVAAARNANLAIAQFNHGLTSEQNKRIEALLGEMLNSARKDNYEQLRRVCETAAKLCEHGYQLDEK